MGSAVLDQVAIDLRPTGASVSDDTVTLRATGSATFDSYLRLYQEVATIAMTMIRRKFYPPGRGRRAVKPRDGNA